MTDTERLRYPRHADYVVRGFRHGELLLETWHVGDASKSVEVEAWKARIRKGDATHCEVVALHQPKIVETYP